MLERVGDERAELGLRDLGGASLLAAELGLAVPELRLLLAERGLLAAQFALLPSKLADVADVGVGHHRSEAPLLLAERGLAVPELALLVAELTLAAAKLPLRPHDLLGAAKDCRVADHVGSAVVADVEEGCVSGLQGSGARNVVRRPAHHVAAVGGDEDVAQPVRIIGVGSLDADRLGRRDGEKKRDDPTHVHLRWRRASYKCSAGQCARGARSEPLRCGGIYCRDGSRGQYAELNLQS